MRRILPVLMLLCVLCLLPLTARAGSGEINGYAFVDKGGGVFDADGRMLSGVSVSLYRVGADGGETRVAQAATGADGFYAFTGLEAGQYRLRAVVPDNYLFTLPRTGGSVMLPACGTQSFSMPIDVAEGERVENAHIGAAFGSTYIKAIVFEDTNQNGGRSTAEPLLRGVPVTLYYEMDGEPVAIASARTDQNGEAIFLHLTPGTYRVGAELPAPYIIGPLGEKKTLWYNCVPPCDSSAGMTDPAAAVKGDSLGVGIGAVSTGSLRGRIWWDEDMNGRRASAEGGYAGAIVRLESEQAGVSREAVTGADGAYRFESLLAGEYMLTVRLPEDAMFALPGGDSLLTEGYDFTASHQVTVTDQAEAAVPDIGVMPVTSLAVRVYNDVNVNGRFDDGEPVFAGAELAVLTGDSVRASALSDGEGVARIPVLRGGNAEVRLSLPDGQVFTVEGEQNDFTALAATEQMSLDLDLAHGQETRLNAGVTLPAAVSGTLFDDIDLSGIMEESEKGLAGFTVQAVNAAGAVVTQTETDENGGYAFRNLLPAEHTVRFLLTDAYVCTDLSESGAPIENHVARQTEQYGETGVLTLTPGLRMTGVSAGIFRSATVSGQVLMDTGIPSLPAEGGMADVRVTLLTADGQPVSDTTATRTREDGSFYLKGALPGSYRLRFTLDEQAAFTDATLGDTVYETEAFDLRVAQDLQWPAVQAIPTGSLRGALYRDADLSAVRDATETGLAGIRIHLDNLDLMTAYDATTGEDGGYAFEKLRPGRYEVRVTLPDGLCFAYDPSSLLPAQVSAEGVSQFDIGIGDHQTDRNIACAAPAALGGTVYYDRQNNGVMETGDNGAEGVTISFTGKDSGLSYTVLTDADGHFRLDAMVPGPYIMRATLGENCVAADHNAARLMEGFWMSRVTLSDGIVAEMQYPILRLARVAGRVWSLDGSLNGVSGRTVNLYVAGIETPLETQITGEDGAFAFEGLKPGSYRLTSDLPDDTYNFARTEDAALHPGTPDVPVGYDRYFSVAMGAEMDACDIGIGAMGALGDTAWLDLNGNGLQEGDEPRLPGIAIALYQYGVLAAETVTDSQGHYLVTDLYPGPYTIHVTVPPELRTTIHRTDYPLAASVLPASTAETVSAEGIIVPSAGRNLNCDLGFMLRREGVYPASLDDLYSTDWSYEGKRKQ